MINISWPTWFVKLDIVYFILSTWSIQRKLINLLWMMFIWSNWFEQFDVISWFYYLNLDPDLHNLVYLLWTTWFLQLYLLSNIELSTEKAKVQAKLNTNLSLAHLSPNLLIFSGYITIHFISILLFRDH